MAEPIPHAFDHRERIVSRRRRVREIDREMRVVLIRGVVVGVIRERLAHAEAPRIHVLDGKRDFVALFEFSNDLHEILRVTSLPSKWRVGDNRRNPKVHREAHRVLELLFRVKAARELQKEESWCVKRQDWKLIHASEGLKTHCVTRCGIERTHDLNAVIAGFTRCFKGVLEAKREKRRGRQAHGNRAVRVGAPGLGTTLVGTARSVARSGFSDSDACPAPLAPNFRVLPRLVFAGEYFSAAGAILTCAHAFTLARPGALRLGRIDSRTAKGRSGGTDG